MISVEKAIEIVLNSKIFTRKIERPIEAAVGYFLAEEIKSPIDMPPFSQSAMDGYAVCGQYQKYEIVGEIKAGDSHQFSLKDGQAFRIYTGAMVPQNTTSIVKQEIVNVNINEIELLEEVRKGTSIRIQGEELKQGDLVLTKGTKISPATVGVLASLGLTKIMVYDKPKVALLVTGNELTKVGEPLQSGKIYESNSYTISAALQLMSIDVEVVVVKDDYNATKNTIESALNKFDLVLLTGGISVGEYDFVGKALSALGVAQKFYKVKQKPGKPLFYGEHNQVKIFALPGNPAAALTGFYVYVKTAINLMMGSSNPLLNEVWLPLKGDFEKKGDRAQFLKAKLWGKEVEILSKQSSAMLTSFSDADGLVYIADSANQIKNGDLVKVLLLNS
ncbi:MAG: molybdopterin molybdotransferase MoeA [Putridiphycobacter sp.]